MSGIETHNFSGSRHDHSVPTLRQGHWKSRCFINVLMQVIGSFCCISVSGSSPATNNSHRRYIEEILLKVTLSTITLTLILFYQSIILR
jgi:hypothetical protein